MEVARTVAMLILSIALPLAVQLLDKRRLSQEQRDRSWNVATWAAALYAFGPLSMLGWIFVTRRRWIRCLVAPLWTLPLVGGLVIADQLLQHALTGHVDDPVAASEVALSALVLYVGAVILLLAIELIIILRRWLSSRGRA